jgi:uncharacterized protein YgiM (DUF1202 family)
MKIKNGLILATMLSTTLGAQTVTNTAPPTLLPPPISTAPAAVPPPALGAGPFSADTNQPAAKPAKSAKKKSAKTAATRKKTKPAAGPDLEITIVPNQPAAPKQDHVNVRGRASINSEVVTHLNRSDTVTVLDVITVKAKTDEPAKWAKITLPAGAHAWVNTSFVDGMSKTVNSTKLNIRSGPGENYSVIGLLHKGDAVKDLSTKGEWTEIEAPPNAYAFVAAHLLAKKEATAAPVAEPTPTPPPPVTSVASNPLSTVPPTTETQVAAVPPPANPPPTLIPQPTVTTPLPQPIVTTPPIAPPVEEGPAVPRVVEREGIVRGTVSIQAPTHYELESLDTHKVIDYLYTTSTNLLLRRYRGMTVMVSGEEGLDERWPNTPVITVQRIQVVQ